MIRRLSSGQYRLYSRKIDPKTGKRRNLGTFPTRAKAEKHERAVQYFKRRGSGRQDMQSKLLHEAHGDIAIGPDGKPSVHAHAVLGRRDGTALAGHLQEAHVRPTLEIIVTESAAHLCKAEDTESGLALIRV